MQLIESEINNSFRLSSDNEAEDYSDIAWAFREKILEVTDTDPFTAK